MKYLRMVLKAAVFRLNTHSSPEGVPQKQKSPETIPAVNVRTVPVVGIDIVEVVISYVRVARLKTRRWL